MIAEIRRPIKRTNPQQINPTDYNKCIAISTNASIKKMVIPGLLVIGSPLVVGVLFGPGAVSGLSTGAIVSRVQITISFSTGGA
jgi:Na+/H+-translocating membrane pyrophosphatase